MGAKVHCNVPVIRENSKKKTSLHITCLQAIYIQKLLDHFFFLSKINDAWIKNKQAMKSWWVIKWSMYIVL